MRNLFFAFILLLSFGCRNSVPTIIKMPEVQPAAEKAKAEFKTRETAYKSTFGKDFGVCDQNSISTILVKKPQNNIKNKPDTITCAVSYNNHCCCIDGNYSSSITIDIIKPQNFRSGQYLALPNENIKIRFEEESDGFFKLGFADKKELIEGILHFDKIAVDTVVLSLLLSIEDANISDETFRKANSSIYDYSQLEFLADTFLTKYEFDYSSFSAVNKKARTFLYSLYPRTNIILNSQYANKIHSGQVANPFNNAAWNIVPEFPGGQEGLINFFKEKFPCPDRIQQYSKPNTLNAVLEIGPDGKVKEGYVNISTAFGFSPNYYLDPSDPDFERFKAILDLKRKLNGNIQELPAFNITNIERNKLDAINFIRYEFPIVFNCD